MYKKELEKKICLALEHIYAYYRNGKPVQYFKGTYKEGFHVADDRYIVRFDDGHMIYTCPDHFHHQYDPDFLIMLGLFFKEE